MTGLVIREATPADLPQIIQLMSDDALGSIREEYAVPLPKCYTDAFNRIANDPNNILLVACDGEHVIGNLQITFTQYLSHKGSKRATIENIRVAKNKRNSGVGTQLMEYAIDLAKKSDSGLSTVMKMLRGIDGIGMVEFDNRDIIRHRLVKYIIEAFDQQAKAQEPELFSDETDAPAAHHSAAHGNAADTTLTVKETNDTASNAPSAAPTAAAATKSGSVTTTKKRTKGKS